MMMSSLIYILPFFFTLFLLLKHYYYTTTTTTKNPPPSPPKLPIIGNLHQLGPLMHRSFSSLSRRYGGRHLMLLHLGTVPSLVVSSADAAHEIMQTHDLIFATRPPATQMHKTLFYDLKEISSAPYGEYWRQAKKLMALNLLNTKKVQQIRAFRDEEIANTLAKITKISEGKNPVNLGDLLFEHANGISWRSTFGNKFDEEVGNKVKKVVARLLKVLGQFYFAETIPELGWIDRISGAHGRVEGVAKEIDELMEEAIEERVAGGGRKTDGDGDGDLEPHIDALLRIQKDGVDHGISFDRDVVKALLTDSYFAGTEATASTLRWIMAELLTHPQILKKAQAEVRTIVDGKQHITDDDLEKMKYMKAIIAESSRLHPPIPLPLPRFATEDVKIMGYDVSKGTRVYINLWAIGRDPEVWDRPDEFLPERFVEAPVDNFKFLPFGGGRRGCPGKVFAMAVVEGLLANLLWKFDWELKDKDGVNLDETVGIANRPKSSFLAFATPFSS